MDGNKLSKAFQQFLRGEISSREFAELATAYYDSPDWRRHKASRAAEDLREWKAGRARLLELVEKVKAEGHQVETWSVPLKNGHDSMMVHIDGFGTGFPSYMPTSVVEAHFADILMHAVERRSSQTPK